MKSSTIAVLITLASTIILVAIYTTAAPDSTNEIANTAIMTEGKQVIDIRAKGGYSPRTTTATANIPTVINIQTSATFDCSASLTIPAIGYTKHLPPSGITTIEIPAEQATGTVRGVCSMGMYSFSITFT